MPSLARSRIRSRSSSNVPAHPASSCRAELEGGRPGDLDRAARRPGAVRRRPATREQRRRQVDVRRGVRLALDQLDAHRLVGRRRRTRARSSSSPSAGQRALDLVGRRRLGLDQAVLDDERRRLAAVVGPEARQPAVELVERAHQPLVPRLRDAAGLAVAVGDLDVLRALADEDLLELRLLLDVALLACRSSPGRAAGRRCRRGPPRRAPASAGRRTSAAACGCATRRRRRRS